MHSKYFLIELSSRTKNYPNAGGGWANAMHDQSDILGNPGPIYCAYPRRAKVGDVDCYPLLKELFKTPDAMFLSAASGN